MFAFIGYLICMLLSFVYVCLLNLALPVRMFLESCKYLVYCSLVVRGEACKYIVDCLCVIVVCVCVVGECCSYCFSCSVYLASLWYLDDCLCVP